MSPALAKGGQDYAQKRKTQGRTPRLLPYQLAPARLQDNTLVVQLESLLAEDGFPESQADGLATCQPPWPAGKWSLKGAVGAWVQAQAAS